MYFASLPGVFKGWLQIILSYRLEIFVVSSCLNCHAISLTLQNKNNRKFKLFFLSTPLQNAHHCHRKRCHQRISRIPDKAAPPALLLPVTKEYGNRHDPHACLVWVPEIEKIPTSLWNHVTDEKRGERVRTIAGLPIGRVPKGLSSCFYELLGSSTVECIEWYVNQWYSFPFY